MGLYACRDQLAAKAVEALRGKRVVLVSGGWRHTVVADEAGSTYSWGWNKARGLRPAAELLPPALGGGTITRGGRGRCGCQPRACLHGQRGMRCLTAYTVLPEASGGDEHACLVLTRVRWRAQCGQQGMGSMRSPTSCR